MKNLILVSALLLLTAVGCKKNDPVRIYQEENPLSSYIVNTGFNQASSNFINAGNYEFGLEFTPMVKGQIKAITFKIPAPATNVRVTIWDATAKTVLRTETIPTVLANTEVKQDITPLALEKDKKYFISYNGSSWYKRNKSDGSKAVYPIIAGNIKITNYNWLYGEAQTFPTTVSSDYYAGDLSFIFQQAD